MFGLNPISALFAIVVFSAINIAGASSYDVVLPLLGADPCTWGPSFWCENEENMKRCGVTKEDCERYAEDLL
ncbi:Saposin A-type domain-containing protein [Fusarium falciforme]|uniref:Saposin A-type domain-containing protein n=1 Tax=Fusarium falciforme TaxID=195108 RepID=UPI0023012A14|nr:Saposin A-type domain-containing protein [Fusarium falciforme]KAJ4260008.1 hypothetical protein NW757_001960 [Fusarium falciforme]WAO84501.1 Saposin A-type domain-containing protein [Fusarium falciforme]